MADLFLQGIVLKILAQDHQRVQMFFLFNDPSFYILIFLDMDVNDANSQKAQISRLRKFIGRKCHR